MLIRHPACGSLAVVVPDTDFVTGVLFLVFVDQEVDVVDIEPNVVLRTLMGLEIEIFLVELLLGVLADEANRVYGFL